MKNHTEEIDKLIKETLTQEEAKFYDELEEQNEPGYVNHGTKFFTFDQVKEIHDDLISQGYLVREKQSSVEEEVYTYHFATVKTGDTIGIIVNYKDKKIPSTDINEHYKRFTLCFEHTEGLEPVDGQFQASFQRRLVDASQHPEMIANAKLQETKDAILAYQNYFDDGTTGVTGIFEYTQPGEDDVGALLQSIFDESKFSDLTRISDIPIIDEGTDQNILDETLEKFQTELHKAKEQFSTIITKFRTSLITKLTEEYKSKLEMFLAHSDSITRDDRRQKYNSIMYGITFEKGFIENAFTLVRDIVA